jgi:hypothetical protein
MWAIWRQRLKVCRGSTSARRPRGEACRRPSWRGTARRRRPDPTRPASVKNPDTSGAAGPPKAIGRRGALAGHQPPLRVFLHCSRSTRAVLHTRPFNRRHQIYTPELRVCCSWSRSRHCRRWALGDGFTESPPRRSAPTCRPGRRRVIGHTGIPQFETPDPVSPWLQNLVTQRSPGMITVSSPREGLITCKSTPIVIPGVTAKL